MKITGEVLKRAVFNDKRTQDAIAKEMGMVRQTLNNLFKRAELTEDQIKAAKEAGLKFEQENDAGELSFLRMKVQLLESQIEDLRLVNETYRTLLLNTKNQEDINGKKDSPVVKKVKP